MASSVNMDVENADLFDGHDGTISSAMKMWAAREGPATYNTWQQLFFKLRRHGTYNDDYEGLGSQAELQTRLKSAHKHVMSELYGDDYLAQAAKKMPSFAAGIDSRAARC